MPAKKSSRRKRTNVQVKDLAPSKGRAKSSKADVKGGDIIVRYDLTNAWPKKP